MKIELQYFDGCPNHKFAHAMLNEVLSARGVTDAVELVDVGEDVKAAESVRFGGSPTIRIDGTDIEPGFTDDGDYTLRCRVFQTKDGLRGMPERQWVETAIDRALAAAPSS